jgi:hypothetical protein
MTREEVRTWLEEATGEGLSVDSTLPDSLTAAAGELGLSAAELRLWVYDLPKADWSPDALALFAWRHGLGVCALRV